MKYNYMLGRMDHHIIKSRDYEDLMYEKDAKLEDQNKRHAGVIAQEVLKVMPEIVSGTDESMYSVAYGNITGLLIEAVKEQNRIIEKQSEEIKELKEVKRRVNEKLGRTQTESKFIEPTDDTIAFKLVDDNVDSVRDIYFAGGEPMISKYHWYTLEKLIEEMTNYWLDHYKNR